MEKQQSALSLIKKGFLLGLGAVIPFAALEIASIKYSFYETELYSTEMLDSFNERTGKASSAYTFVNSVNQENATDGETTSTTNTESTSSEDAFSSYNRSYAEDIRLSPHQATVQNGRLLIKGSLTNDAKMTVDLIEIEAELFKDGAFVYECATYIDTKIKPSQSENYMIRCGCGKGDIPQFDDIKVKVSRASSY